MSERNTAVYVRNVCFSYSNSEPILKGINLRIERASIYSLLGSSGCGKTTLLKCILGRLKPSSGEIKIFGSKPGSPESHIPGTGVGYMPQELSLYFEFTIEEILKYFGRIYSMNKKEIKVKVEELKELLQLSEKNKYIGRLSGGQQRRVSLACTLIHSPPLLILDEPTVGTDPLLRHNIWCHLVSLCKSGHTIIVTTHYIDEARNARTVAFMRKGKILVEDNPQYLLDKYNTVNLEDVFLHLCQLQSISSIERNDVSVVGELQNEVIPKINIHTENGNINSIRRIIKYLNRISKDVQGITLRLDDSDKNQVFCISMERRDEQMLNSFSEQNSILSRKSRFTNRCTALLHKNFRRLTRNWGHLIFELIFPSLLFLAVVICIGDGPINLKLAIFNGEQHHNVTDGWGGLFLESIDHARFNFHYFDSFEKALDSVKSGENHAVIHIEESFTKELLSRYLYMNQMNENSLSLEKSGIDVHIDRSNQLIGLQIERYLYEAMNTFIEVLANKTDKNPKTLKFPLNFMEPVYGYKHRTQKDFAVPGSYIVMTYFTSAVITAHMMLEERKDGLLARSIVAGITTLEFVVSNLLTQFVIVCWQILILFVLSYTKITPPINGSIILFLALLLSQSFCGVAFGLLVSVFVSDSIVCGLILMVVYITSIVSSGVIWPFENLPLILQYINLFAPNTIPIQSMRSIMYREWTIDYFQVYIGFIVTYIWFTIFLIISLIFLKRNL